MKKVGILIGMLCYTTFLFAQKNATKKMFNITGNIFATNIGLGLGYNSDYHNRFGYSLAIDISAIVKQKLPDDFDCWIFKKLDGLTKIQALALYKLGNSNTNYAVLGAGPAFCSFGIRRYESASSSLFSCKYDSKFENQKTIGLQTEAKYFFYIAENMPVSIGGAALLSNINNVITISSTIGIDD